MTKPTASGHAQRDRSSLERNFTQYVGNTYQVKSFFR